MDESIIKKQKRAAHNKSLLEIDPNNHRIMTQIKGVSPKYAEHMMRRNGIIEMFAKYKYGSIDILDLPVCGKCEKPGAWHDKPPHSCYCFPCGHVTAKTMPLRDYMAQELNEFKGEHLKRLEDVISQAFPDLFNETISEETEVSFDGDTME